MIQVAKRNGTKVPFDIEKIHKIINWAIDGLDVVSLSDIEMNTKLSLYDGITTREIHSVLVKSASNLTSIETPNYQYVAARLANYALRKEVWGDFEPPRLYEHILSCVEKGVYDSVILEKYTESEIHKIGKIVKHHRDDLYTYCGIQQMIDKYLIRDRDTNQYFETPQFAYILVSMVGFMEYPKETRISYIKKFYDAISTFKISLPTPLVAGARSTLRQFASCTLFDCDDSLDSIFATATALGHYSAKRAGIGLNMSHIRPINSLIRKNEVIHTGIIPYLKVFESIVKSTQQNALRGASANVNVQFWHPEILDVLVLKDNSGTDDNRVRKLDYTIQLSRIFYERLIKNENITLFSPHECPELYNSFGLPNFDEKYIAREKDTSLRYSKVIKARELAEVLAKQRYETGRIYIMNIDTCNSHNPFKDRVNMTNLCCISKDAKLDCMVRGDLDKYGKYECWDIETVVEAINFGLNVFVLSKNVENGQISYCKVIAGDITRRNAELVLIKAMEYTLKCTPDHLIYTNRGYVRADSISKEDVIEIVPNVLDVSRTVNGAEITILVDKEDVYDITVQDNQNFYANGILVHNCEITHPVSPIDKFEDENGEIGVCILSAVNMLETKLEELPEVAEQIVRFLDEIIDYQEYPVKAAERFTKSRRSLGVGVTNLAAFFATNKVGYGSPESLLLLDEYIEHLQFSLLKASLRLAKEKGVCEKYIATKYSDGWLPIDTANEKAYQLTSRAYSCDWESLRAEIKEHGLRHSTLLAFMPVHSTSVIQNATNGVEPIRELITYQKSKTGNLKQVIPRIKYAKYYTRAADIKSNDIMNGISAVIQKWCEMSISTNHYYNPNNYPQNNIPSSVIIKDIVNAYTLGVKTLYYANTFDGDNSTEGEISCPSGACSV